MLQIIGIVVISVVLLFALTVVVLQFRRRHVQKRRRMQGRGKRLSK